MNSVTLEVLIAMAGGYFVLAFVLTAVIEALAAFCAWRSELLRNTIANFLGERRLSQAFYSDPVIRSLFSPRFLRRRPQLPSSIRPGTFAETLVRILFRPPLGGPKSKTLTAKYVGERLAQLQAESPETRGLLISRLRFCRERARSRAKREGADFGEMFLAEIAALFGEVVDRLKGRYRRRVMVWSIALGVIGSACINFDSIQLVQSLYGNAQVREAVVIDAVQLGQGGAAGGAGEVSAAREVLGGLPLGWSAEGAVPPTGWAIKIIGFLISGLALSLGAPFWFDLLGKLTSLRSGGKNSEEEEKKKTSVTAAKPIPTADGEKPETSAEVVVEAAETTTELARSCLGRLGDGAASGASMSDSFALAEVSRLAYQPPEALRSALGSDWSISDQIGADEAAGLGTANGRFLGDTQVFVLKNEKKRVAVLVFRGTEPRKLADLWTDLQIEREAERDLGEVHEGFRQALDASGDGEPSLQEKVAGLLDPLLLDGEGAEVANEHRPYSLWVTGHSLGGALAHLFAARYLRDRPAARELFGGCVTFGEPRVGNHAFAGKSQQLGNGRFVRFVNDLDIVARIPLRSLGYAHTTPSFTIDNAGRMAVRGGLNESFFRWVQYLTVIVLKWRKQLNASTGIKEPLEDHGIENYVLLLAASVGMTPEIERYR